MVSPEFEKGVAIAVDFIAQYATRQTPAEFRALYREFLGRVPPPPEVCFESEDAGGVPAEWAVPPGVGDAVIFYLHGGGYMVGDPLAYRRLAGCLALAAEARVLTVDYRLAPEHPCPAAADDAFTAYRWLVARHDPGRIVIGGDSAGGALTVITLVRARDSAVALAAAGFCLSPWTDLAVTGPSVDALERDDPVSSRASLEGAAAAYLQGRSPMDPLASPLYSADVGGLPPFLLMVGGRETLVDDARRLAARMVEDGTFATLEIWDEMIHVWPGFVSDSPEAADAHARIGRFVAEHTARGGGPTG